MANELKTGPYEILLRFSCEAGEKRGALRGMSSSDMMFLVDEDDIIVGRMDRGREDTPKPIEREALVALLGEQMVAIGEGVDALRLTNASERDALKAEHAAEVEKLKSAHEAAVGSLAAEAKAEIGKSQAAAQEQAQSVARLTQEKAVLAATLAEIAQRASVA